MVDGRGIAHVADAVELVRGLEDDGARPDPAGLSVDHRLQGSLLDDDQLLVGVLVGRMRVLAGGEGRDVELQLVEGRGGVLEDLTGSTLGRPLGLDFLPLHSERYDLVMRKRTGDLPAAKAFLDVLQRATLRRKLEVLAGYDTSQMGTVVA